MSETQHRDDGPQAAVPTMDRSGKRRWLYPDRRKGPRASRRGLTALGLIVIYLLAPWLTWNHVPVFRLDVIEKKAFLFGQVFQVNDAALIAPLMATLALLLLFATSLKGRIWCAYGCPQTVFVEWVIRPIEELTEGSAHHRRRMDASPLTPERVLRKIIKHGLFLVVAAIVANTFLSFFFGPERIARWMVSSPSEHPGPFAVMMFVMLGFYFDLAWFREQFCAFLCPYARFQSVMLDQDTPTVAYDISRGEPRGQDRGKSTQRTHGDCIDCQLCVRVCPTGIDIRQGLQLECIMCARCMDACDMVMQNLGRPKGLIRIASQNELTGTGKIAFWRRPKVIAFGLAVAIMVGGGLVKVFGRDSVALTVIRAPGPAYTVMPDGRLGNTFIIRATNNTASKVKLNLVITEPKGATLLCAQCGADLESSNDIRATAIVAFDKTSANKPLVIENETTHDQGVSMLIGPSGP